MSPSAPLLLCGLCVTFFMGIVLNLIDCLLMLYAVLFFESDGDKAVHHIWQALADADVSSSMLDK